MELQPTSPCARSPRDDTLFARALPPLAMFSLVLARGREVHPKWVLALGLVLLLGVGGCARNPVTGRPQAVLTSAAGEIEQDEAAAAAVEARIGLVDDPQLAAYIETIGQRLAQHSPRQDVRYQFGIVESAAPNAFALPAGHVYVSRGLLALVNSEDELANVLGHEIGHVAARHSAQQQVRSALFFPVRLAAALGGAATSIVSPLLGSVVSGLGQLPSALVLASYSRDQEREADRLGQKLAGAAGWDPAALASFMHTLARDEALAGGDPDRVSFFASHPGSPERRAQSLAFASTVARGPAAPFAGNRAAFLGRIEGIVVGEPAAEGVFIETRFLQPAQGFAITFPEKWETRNTRSAVIAHSSDKMRFVVLGIAGKGDDPLDAARALAAESGMRGEPQALRIAGLPAAHGIGEAGSGRDRRLLHLTWIAYRGTVYQLSGVSPPAHFEADVGTFAAVSRSFRPLGALERAEIRESRLRIAEPRPGETLAGLVERRKSSWSPERAAVANGIELDEPLEPGAMLKLAQLEPYASD